MKAARRSKAPCWEKSFRNGPDTQILMSSRATRNTQGLQPRHINDVLSAVLRPLEQRLRQMAAEEMYRDGYTPGLSRCLELLDDERWQP